MDVTQLVRQAVPVEYATLARGHVYGGENHPKAAPTSFTERVWVILPEGSTEHLYGPCKWLAGHGTTKPQPGSECVVGFDEQNQPTLVWWDGVQTEPSLSGSAGGDLSGSYPNPSIKAEAVTEAKLAAAVQETLKSKVEGEGEVTWAGGSHASGSTSITGVASNTGHYFVQSISVGRIWFATVLAPEATKFKVQGYAPTEEPVAATKEKFRWVVWTK